MQRGMPTQWEQSNCYMRANCRSWIAVKILRCLNLKTYSNLTERQRFPEAGTPAYYHRLWLLHACLSSGCWTLASSLCMSGSSSSCCMFAASALCSDAASTSALATMYKKSFPLLVLHEHAVNLQHTTSKNVSPWLCLSTINTNEVHVLSPQFADAWTGCCRRDRYHGLYHTIVNEIRLGAWKLLRLGRRCYKLSQDLAQFNTQGLE